MVNVESIIEKVKKYNPHCNAARIRNAFIFAQEAHGKQTRKSGEPFIIHPLWIADALTAYRADEDTVIAALLHDVIEDTAFDSKTIRKKFGEDVAFLVEGVTKVRKEFKKIAYAARKMDTLRKLISSIAEDQRVLLIKLLDRKHNMRTLSHLPPKRQQKIAQETLNYYVPLAKSISLWDIKSDLENMAFKTLKPIQYEHFRKMIHDLTRSYRTFFTDIKKGICRAFAKTNIPVKVDIMVLTPYEILELKQKGLDIKKNFFQIIIRTESEESCYLALGIIHKLWKPVIKYFNDHVAVPKDNHYQALHTSVIGNKGQMLKILIQTDAMYDFSRKSAPFDRNSVRNLRTSLGQIDKNGNSEYYLKSVTEEVFCDYVNFFDNEGNSYRLPAGASLIDYYFYLQEQHIKALTGRISAYVNDQKVSLRKVIQNDDVIRFMRAVTNHKITPFLLRYAKTSLARKGIKGVLAGMKQKDAILEGKKLIKDELQRTGLRDFEKFSSKDVDSIIKSLNLEGKNDLLEKMGRGKIDTANVLFAFYSKRFCGKTGKPSCDKAQYIAMRIINNRNRVGFVKDILDTFQKLDISIQEIKGYSPKSGKLGIIDLRLFERVNAGTFRNTILPLCNALEQIESVASVALDFSLCKYDI